MTAPTRTIVDLDETSLDLFMDGDDHREPLLLLHPWFGCWRFWLRLMPLMTDRWCIAPDLYSPSHGQWQAMATPRGLADAVVASMDRLGIERADLIGNSVGGIAAQVLAIHHPDRVRRLVLVGTGPFTSGVSPMFAEEVNKWVTEPEAAHRAGAARAMAVLTAMEIDPDEFDACIDIVEGADPRYVGAVLKSCREADLRAELNRVTAPTLIIRGSFDPIRTREHSDALVAGIAGARAIEMPRTGHAPYVDDPDAFAGHVRQFFAEAGG